MKVVCVEQNMGVCCMFSIIQEHIKYFLKPRMNCMVKVLKEDTILFHHNGFMLVRVSFSEYQSFGVCSFGFIHFGTRYH